MSDLDNWTIKSFRILQDYIVELIFVDGKKQTINFEPVIGKGWMAQLKDKAYFDRVSLNNSGNLKWPDGQDFNPKALYDREKFEQAYIEDMKRM